MDLSQGGDRQESRECGYHPGSDDTEGEILRARPLGDQGLVNHKNRHKDAENRSNVSTISYANAHGASCDRYSQPALARRSID